MPHPSSLNFASQDLRNRCFRQQTLNEADFRGADLRGCDFTLARLQFAQFDRAITGQSRKQILLPLGLTVGVAIAAIEAISHLLFGVLGRTAAEPGWSFVIALVVSLAIAGAGALLPRRSKSLALLLSGTASGALLSFYYGGSAADNNSQVAIASAIIGGGATLLLLWRSLRVQRWRSLVAAPIAIAAAIAAYALSGFAATWAAAYFSIRSPLGWVWSAVAAVYFASTLVSLRQTATIIRTAGGTSFRAADLTGATFTDAKLTQTDFTGAIGFAGREPE